MDEIRKRPKGGSQRRPGGKFDAEAVATLAAYGLTAEEILVKLEVPLPLPAGKRKEFAAAIRRGRALGSAKIKQAQFEAALEGRVSAQSHVLSTLGSGDDKGATTGGEPIRVIREIIKTCEDTDG